MPRNTGKKPSKTTGSRSKSTRSKKAKKKASNPTPFIIGGVAAFFLLIIIIAAASGGSSSTPSQRQYMSLSERKNIYSSYLTKCKQIEDDAKAGLARLDPETRKRASRMTTKKIGNLKYAEVNKLQGKYEKRIKGLPKDYIEKYVIRAGRKNGW